MLRSRLTIVVGVALVLFSGVFGFAIRPLLLAKPEYTIPTITDWPVYQDDALGITFQYPAKWTVVSDGNGIVRISPPDTDSRQWDSEAGPFYTYGIRVIPLDGPYPAFPVEITQQDLSDHFARINSFYFDSAELQLSDGQSLSLIYNIAHDGRSLLAFKAVGESVLQLEMGRHFTGTPTVSEIVAFFGVLASLHEPTRPVAKALAQ